jgi:MoxR-like ATPase
VVLLGPWGAAKSELLRALCGAIETAPGGFFRKLIWRTSTEEDLFGPTSVKGLEEDTYRRNLRRMLPEARVAFLDEVFKGSSALLNTLLELMNERTFRNGPDDVEVPLELLVAASNELPEDREELGAFWDRFMLRYTVGYIKERKNFEVMLDHAIVGKPAPRARLTWDDVAEARAGAAAVDVRPAKAPLAALWEELGKKNVAVSDRRYFKCLSLVRVHAYLEGRDAAAEEDLAILQHALWQDPDQLREVRKAVFSVANPQLHEAQDLLDEASEVHAWAMAAEEEEKFNRGQEANAKLRRITEKLMDLKADAQAAGRSADRIEGLLKKAGEMNGEVLKKCMGLNI